MRKAYLLLEDSSIWEGFSFGAPVETDGEAVFTTGMVGYPEALTDASYAGQIVTFTYPLQGNYGVSAAAMRSKMLKNFESNHIQARAMIVSSYVDTYSHWTAKRSLDTWLREEKIPGLHGIDTRALTKRLREKGVMLGKISHTPTVPKNWNNPIAQNLVETVSVKKPVTYGSGSKTIIVVDCGVKHSILFQLIDLGVKVLRVPWDFDIANHKRKFDAVVISNGPGNPMQPTETKQIASFCLSADIPVLGICLGNQILALAAGGTTVKLPYGHRSHNQPAQDTFTKRAYMTTQNHGFTVNMKSMPSEWNEWFTNLNDGTNEGLKHKKKPFWATQFHPEGVPGPYDTAWVFKDFLKMVDTR